MKGRNKHSLNSKILFSKEKSMEFSVFKSQAEAYQNTHTLNDNIRYILAKKKIDVIFSPLLFKKLQRNYS